MKQFPVTYGVTLPQHANKMFNPSRGSLPLFLRMNARGRCIDIVRAEAARRRREMRPYRSEAVISRDSDAVLIQAEAALVVRDALALLPRTERDPIYLAFFSGLKYQEVATRLRLPEGTVKSRIRAGLRHLKENTQVLDLCLGLDHRDDSPSESAMHNPT